jgi:hypothetical protein
MKLPGHKHALVDLAKLRDYSLSAHHARGRHKARVFGAALGLTAADAEFLQGELLRVAREGDAIAGDTDEYGARYTIDFELVRGSRRATVRSAWIILRGESIPRLTTCYVLLDEVRYG